MIFTIAELRKANGGLGNLSDEQIVQNTYQDYQRYFSSQDEYAAAVGYSGAGRGLTGSRISSGIDSYQGQLYGAAEAVARSAGMDGVADYAAKGRVSNKQSSDYASDRAKQLGGIDDWRDVSGPRSFLNYAGGLAAQSAPQMAATATGALLGGLAAGPAGAIAGGIATSYPGNMGDILDNQREQTEKSPGGERTDLLSAAALAVPYTLLDNLTGVGGKITRGLSRTESAVAKAGGKQALDTVAKNADDGINFLERGLNRISSVKGGLARTGYVAVKDGLEEAAGETGQEFMNQFGRMAVDPSAEIFSADAQKRYADSGVGGLVLGGLIGAGGNRGRRFTKSGAANAADVAPDLTGTDVAPPDALRSIFPAAEGGTQGQINQRLGIDTERYAGKDYAKQFEMAAAEPTGERVVGADGVEIADSALDSVQRQAGILEEQRQRAQDIKTQSDQVAVSVEERKQRAADVGLDPKKGAVFNLFGQLEDAHNEGSITDGQFAENLGMLKASQMGVVSKFLKGMAAQNEAVTQSAGTDKQTALDALQQKAPDVQNTPAASATQAQTPAVEAPKAGAPAQTGAAAAGTPTGTSAVEAPGVGQTAAPTATATNTTPEVTPNVASAPSTNVAAAPGVAVRPSANEVVSTAAPALAAPAVSVAPVNAQPKAAAKAESVGPTANGNAPASAAQRATLALKTVGIPPDRQIAVVRNGKVVNETALSLWTNLLNNPLALRRAQQSMGADAQWNVVNSPQSFADIAAGDGTSRQAVTKQMLGFGIKESTVDAAVASDGNMAPRTGTALEEESNAAGATPVPKTSDETVQAEPVTGTESEGGADYTGGAGYRVESTPAKAMGEGLVQGKEETRTQRAARVKADELLSINKDLDRAVTAKSAEDTRQELENQRRADAKYAAVLEHPKAEEARVDWDEIKQTDSPSFSELVTQVRAAWVDLHAEQVSETGNEYSPIKKLVERFERDLEDADHTKISSNTDVSDRTAGVDRQAAGDATGRADRAGANDAAVQPGASRTVESGETGARSPAAQPTVVTKKRRTIQRSDAPDSRGSSDAGQLRTELAKFIRVDALGRSVVVVQSAEDLPMGASKVQSLGINDQTQAFVLDGQAYLIADNIAPGNGKAVFLHEVGVHLGLERLLTKQGFDRLTSKLQEWADKNDGSVESKLSQKALARVGAAKTNAQDRAGEHLAYFVEEAVNAGVDPTATTYNTPFARWFRDLYAAFKIAARKLGINIDKLNAQDVVNMAYGAARLETQGKWHGTAATFRKFNNDFMGTGEGAQAYGWGTYMAERRGIGNGYFEQDVARKTTYARPDHSPRGYVALDGAVTKFEDAKAWVLANTEISNVGQAGMIVSYIQKGQTGPLASTLKPYVDAVSARISHTEYDGKTKPEGALMRVDHNVQDNEMLLWDAPLSEQSEAVKNALNATTENRIEDFARGQTGQQLYKYLERDLGSDKAASMYLDSIGIKGIKHVDASSRGKENALTVDGKQYTEDDLKDLGRGDDGPLKPYVSLLRQILRDGSTAPARKELEGKLAQFREDGARINKESSERYGVQVTPDGMKRSGEAYAESTYHYGQLKWLNENADKIKVQKQDVTYNHIIFNDKNILRVATNPGADSSRIQFSQAADLPPVAKSHTAVASAFKEAVTSAGEIGSSLLKKAVFTHDLIDMASKVLPAAKGYLTNINAVNAEKVKLAQAVQDVVADFRALTAVEQGQGPLSVNSFLHDSTMRKAWGYAPEGKPGTVVDPELGARYQAMTPAAQAVIAKVFAHGDTVRKQLIAANTATVNREFADDIAAAQAKGDTDALTKLTADRARALKDVGKGLVGDWPYTPMSRFGDHVVLATSARYMAAVKAGDKAGAAALQSDANHYHVDRTDSMRSARQLVEKMRADFPGGHVTSFERGPENNVVYGGRDALGALTRLRNLVRDSADDNPGLDKTANTAIDKMLRDLHLQLLSETSARKSQLGRVNVAGANLDMMRSFAGHGQSMAHYIATLRMDGAVQDSLDTMKAQAEAHTPGDTERRSYFNEILRRHVLNMNYEPNATVEKIMATSSVWSLLTNPAHHLMNSLQTVMISLPQMAGKHGYARSASTLTTAYRDLGPIVRGASFKESDFGKLPKDVQAMARALADRGSIGVDQGLELGSFESAPDGKTHPFHFVVHKLRAVSEGVEAVNRLSTAIAAYRLERTRGATEQAATDYAHKIVYETHGDYSGFNAPRFMRSGVGRIATQFRKFQLIQLTLYTKLLQQSFAGASADERAVARKTLAFNMAHLLAMGGTMALPGFSTIAWVLGKAFGDPDTPDDPEATLRRAIGDKGLADLLLHGAPKLGGIDMTTRLGMGDITSPMPYAEPDLSRKGYASVLMGMAGPFVGGLLPRAFDGLGLMSQSMKNGQAVDFYKGLEQLMPNGMGNMMKAARYQLDGVSQRNGDVVLKPEDISVMDSMAQAFGLPTNPITDRNFLNQTMYKAKDFYKEHGEQIKRSYVEAYKTNDAQTMTEARGKWQTMQAALRDQGYAVQPLSTLIKAPMEALKRERNVLAGVEVNKRTKHVVELLEQ